MAPNVPAHSTTCSSCERDFPVFGLPNIPNGDRNAHAHAPETCIDCWHRWLEVQVETQAFDRVLCAQCPTVLGQNEIRALATPEVYHRYLAAEFTATMSPEQDFRWCISASCSSGQIHEGGEIFTCVACRAKHCVSCQAIWHPGVTCAEFQDRKKLEKDNNTAAKLKNQGGPSDQDRQKMEELGSDQLVKQISKLCPKCTRKLEKTGGCDHMTCSSPSPGLSF